MLGTCGQTRKALSSGHCLPKCVRVAKQSCNFTPSPYLQFSFPGSLCIWWLPVKLVPAKCTQTLLSCFNWQHLYLTSFLKNHEIENCDTIAHVPYIKILTSDSEAFSVLAITYMWFSFLCAQVSWELRDNWVVKNSQFCPYSLGAMLGGLLSLNGGNL